MEPVCPWLLDVVLLRCGKIPMSVEDCFPRRVVKALASDILDGRTVEECQMHVITTQLEGCIVEPGRLDQK